MYMRAHLREMMKIRIFLLGKKHISEKSTFGGKILLYRSNPDGRILGSIIRSIMSVLCKICCSSIYFHSELEETNLF